MDLRPSNILLVPPPARLAEAIARELSGSAPSPTALAEAVRMYALEAYARLVPPERVLMSIKAIVADAPAEADPRTRAEFTAALIPFAIEGYYLDSWYRRTGAPKWRTPERPTMPAEVPPGDLAPLD